MSDTQLLTLQQAKERYDAPLIAIVLEWLTIMERIVNQPKQPPVPETQWEALGDVLDREAFRRVGNYGVRNDWNSYRDLLTQWANMSWWQGYIGRTRAVPGGAGQPSLVYMETEERSNRDHPVKDDGDYETLASIAVYEIDDAGKVRGIHVYDQHPL